MFENHRKSLIQNCERSELRLHFEWTLRHIDDFGNITFTYEVIQAEPNKMNFYPQHYYIPIGQGRIDNNPRLVENPGY